jgi:hypothetical protein
MFTEIDMVAGCCGYDGHKDWQGTLSESIVHHYLNTRLKGEQYYDEWAAEWKQDDDARLPIVFASSIGEDGKDYIVHVASWADAQGWHYIRTPSHRNTNTQNWVAMIILYPPDVEKDLSYMKVVVK